MTPLVVPCEAGGASSWTQRTTLDRREYFLTFDWYQRDGHWRLSLALEDGTPVATGLVLVSTWPLLAGLASADRPAGELVVVDTQATGDVATADPGFSDLGTRYLLVYLAVEDVG